MSKMNEIKLDQLREIYTSNPHITQRHVGSEEWIKKGRPYTWILVEEYNHYKVYIDISYGLISLFFGNELLGSGKNIITSKLHNIIILCPHFYDVNNYIHFSSFLLNKQES